jgi:carbohydrate diacid regulator
LLKVGVGNCSALIHQSRSYQSAVLALNSLGYRESYADFDDLDLEILLGSMNDSAKRHFLSKTIHVLDEKQRALLRAYFQNDTSLKQTCEHLYLHKNTLQYQLDKIGQTCGYNPRRFQDAVVLFLALKLEDKQENEIKKDRETDTE